MPSCSREVGFRVYETIDFHACLFMVWKRTINSLKRAARQVTIVWVCSLRASSPGGYGVEKGREKGEVAPLSHKFSCHAHPYTLPRPHFSNAFQYVCDSSKPEELQRVLGTEFKFMRCTWKLSLRPFSHPLSLSLPYLPRELAHRVLSLGLYWVKSGFQFHVQRCTIVLLPKKNHGIIILTNYYTKRWGIHLLLL